MADDTLDQTKKAVKDLTDSLKKGGAASKEVTDQIRILDRSVDHLGEAAKMAAKQARELHREIDLVTNAFANPAETFSGFLQKGVSTGEDLLRTFSAIAGLVFDEPLKKANAELDKEKKKLDELMKQRHEGIKIGDDNVKQLQEKLKNEKDLCDRVTKCDENKVKSLEEQLKTEGDKLKALTDDVKLNDDIVKEQEEQVKKAEALKKKLESQIGFIKDMIASFSDAFDRFVELDKAAGAFRQKLGLSREAARGLEKTALELNQQFVTLGVNIDKAYESLAALGNVFGTSLLINKELAQTTSLLAANYGVSEANAAGFLQKMSSIGGMTDKQASAMAGFTANLANAAGVNLDEVMRDVANASDDTVTLMRGNVKQMTLAAVQAKQLGVSLDKSASSAKGLLNFTQSVSDEMEASVLLGKNLNLNAARQLAFQGDVAGAQKEILNQVRSMGDFNKMNVFQQEALAKATGYSAVELTKMLKNEEKLAQLSDKEKASYEKALEAMKEQNEETGKELLMRTQMQSAMAQLSNTFMAFKQILADILPPVVNVAVKLLIPALKVALLVFNAILVPVKILANALYKMFEPLEPLIQAFSDALDGANGRIETIVQGATDIGVLLLKVNSAVMLFGASFRTFLNPISIVFKIVGGFFSVIDAGATRLLGRISGISSAFGSASGVVGKFVAGFGNIGRIGTLLGTAGKAIPVAGTVIAVLQGIWGLFSRLQKGMGFFDALGETLYDVFIGPFELLVDLLAKLPGVGKFFEMLKPVFPAIKSALSSVFGYFKEGFDAMKELFSGKDILKNLFILGKAILSYVYFLPVLIFKTFTALFPNLWSSITGMFEGGFSGVWDSIVEGAKSFVSMIGNALLTGITSFGQLWYNLFIQPWVDAWDFVSNLFVGKSNSTLGDGIIKGLVGVGSAILSIFTSPFEFIFEMIMKGFSSIGQFIQNVLSVPFKIVGKLIGVDTGGINAGADAAAGPQENVIAAIEKTNQKLDTLINLMMSGGIAVNLDGRKVSEQLALAST